MITLHVYIETASYISLSVINLLYRKSSNGSTLIWEWSLSVVTYLIPVCMFRDENKNTVYTELWVNKGETK